MKSILICIFACCAAASYGNGTAAPKLTLTKIGNKSYYIERNATLNWFAASDFCRSNNWHLATVNNAQEHEALTKHLRKFVGNNKHWVSLNDLGKEKKWVWSGTGAKSTFFSWDNGQPDNKGGIEHCVEFRAPTDKGMKWNDLNCNRALNFICEASPTATIVAPSKPNNTQIFFTKVFSWSSTKLL